MYQNFDQSFASVTVSLLFRPYVLVPTELTKSEFYVLYAVGVSSGIGKPAFLKPYVKIWLFYVSWLQNFSSLLAFLAKLSLTKLQIWLGLYGP